MTEKIINVQTNHKNCYHIGDVFSLNNMFYMLVACDVYHDDVCLVNLSTGGNWTRNIIVENVYNITESELDKIMDGKRGLFAYVQELTISGK